MACFTRPEFAAERVSYPCITPPAAVGLLSAIFWKPEIRWRVEEIWVCSELRWMSITRNEVSDRASKDIDHLDPSERRVQRNSLLLRNVAYVINAQIETIEHATDPVAKYRDQFRRRVDRGACFARPYLGLQEFHAEFRSTTEDDRPDASLTLPIGPMPLDLRHHEGPKGQEQIDPVFWPASIVEGRLRVPAVSEVADVDR